VSERRKNPRVLTLKTGKLSISNRASAIDCAILDISDTGACLLVPADAEVPGSFSLAIDGDQEPHYCTMKWKRGARLGVEFQPEQDA
jgi:hypothetical protein